MSCLLDIEGKDLDMIRQSDYFSGLSDGLSIAMQLLGEESSKSLDKKLEELEQWVYCALAKKREYLRMQLLVSPDYEAAKEATPQTP